MGLRSGRVAQLPIENLQFGESAAEHIGPVTKLWRVGHKCSSKGLFRPVVWALLFEVVSGL